MQTMEMWRRIIPVVADLHHPDEEQEPDPLKGMRIRNPGADCDRMMMYL